MDSRDSTFTEAESVTVDHEQIGWDRKVKLKIFVEREKTKLDRMGSFWRFMAQCVVTAKNISAYMKISKCRPSPFIF